MVVESPSPDLYLGSGHLAYLEVGVESCECSPTVRLFCGHDQVDQPAPAAVHSPAPALPVLVEGHRPGTIIIDDSGRKWTLSAVGWSLDLGPHATGLRDYRFIREYHGVSQVIPPGGVVGAAAER